jgi:hypothetical protein
VSLCDAPRFKETASDALLALLISEVTVQSRDRKMAGNLFLVFVLRILNFLGSPFVTFALVLAVLSSVVVPVLN